MAEQVLKYRVELDDTELSQQLENIRNKINSEVGSFTANTMAQTPLVIPANSNSFGVSSNIGSESYAPPEVPTFSEFYSTPGYPTVAFTPGFQNSVPDQTGTFSNMGKQASILLQNVGSNVSTGTEAAFNDLQMFGQNTKTGLNSIMPDTQPGSFINNMIASIGLGYDARMPLSYTNYKQMAIDQSAETVESIGQGIASFGVDAALFAVPTIGPFVGTAKAIFDLTVPDIAKETDELAKGIQTLGTMQFGPMAKSDALEIAEDIRSYVTSEEGFKKDMKMSDVEEVIANFAGVGGLSNVTNSQELKQKVDDVMKNFREVMHILGTTQEEAALIMGEMERRQLVSAINMPSFAAEMQVNGFAAGMPGVQLLQNGLQIVDQLTGTGYGQENAFQLGIDASVEVSRLANSLNPYYRQNIIEQGGTEAAIQKAIKNTIGIMGGTPLGQSLALGYNNYGADFLTKDLIEQLDANAALFENGIGDWFEFKGKAYGAFSGMDLEMQAMTQISSLYKLATLTPEIVNEDGTISENKFLGFARYTLQKQGLNVSIEDLKTILNLARAAGQTPTKNKAETQVELTKLMSYFQETDYNILRDLGGRLLGPLAPILTGISDFAYKSMYKPVGKAFSHSWTYMMDKLTGNQRMLAEDYRNDLPSDEIYRDFISDDSEIRKYELGLSIDNEYIKSTRDMLEKNFKADYTNLGEDTKNFIASISNFNITEDILKLFKNNEIKDENAVSNTELLATLMDLGDTASNLYEYSSDEVDSLKPDMLKKYNTLVANNKFKIPSPDISSTDLLYYIYHQLNPDSPPTRSKLQGLYELMINKTSPINQTLLTNGLEIPIEQLSVAKAIAKDIGNAKNTSANKRKEFARFKKFFEAQGILTTDAAIEDIANVFGTVKNLKDYAEKKTNRSGLLTGIEVGIGLPLLAGGIGLEVMLISGAAAGGVAAGGGIAAAAAAWPITVAFLATAAVFGGGYLLGDALNLWGEDEDDVYEEEYKNSLQRAVDQNKIKNNYLLREFGGLENPISFINGTFNPDIIEKVQNLSLNLGTLPDGGRDSGGGVLMNMLDTTTTATFKDAKNPKYRYTRFDQLNSVDQRSIVTGVLSNPKVPRTTKNFIEKQLEDYERLSGKNFSGISLNPIKSLEDARRSGWTIVKALNKDENGDYAEVINFLKENWVGDIKDILIKPMSQYNGKSLKAELQEYINAGESETERYHREVKVNTFKASKIYREITGKDENNTKVGPDNETATLEAHALYRIMNSPNYMTMWRTLQDSGDSEQEIEKKMRHYVTIGEGRMRGGYDFTQNITEGAVEAYRENRHLSKNLSTAEIRKKMIEDRIAKYELFHDDVSKIIMGDDQAIKRVQKYYKEKTSNDISAAEVQDFYSKKIPNKIWEFIDKRLAPVIDGNNRIKVSVEVKKPSSVKDYFK